MGQLAEKGNLEIIEMTNQGHKLPLVSVVMAVYNGKTFLKKAIDSILDQTYRNLELIIIDDGSTDSSPAIIKSYKDPRIIYIRQKNNGLAISLNKGISQAKGKYIARMDADDISLSQRLQKQVTFLEENPEVGLIGTSFDLINLRGKVVGHSYHLDRYQDVRAEFLVRNPFGHGTIMVRSEVLKEVGVYDTRQIIEDYELWWRISKSYNVANLTEILYQWRLSPAGISTGDSDNRQEPITKLMKRIWTANISIPSLLQIFNNFSHYRKIGDEYSQQYLHMLAALYLGMMKMGYRAKARRVKVALTFIPDSKRAVDDFQKDPFSHNYNLPIIFKIKK